MDERRVHKRHLVWFPVRIDAEGEKATLAVSKDVSPGGMLVASAAELEVGSTVKVSFQVPTGDQRVRDMEGTIVRITKNEDDPYGAWRYKIAVQFEQPVSALEELLVEAEDAAPAPQGWSAG